MFKNTLFSKAVGLVTLYAFSAAITPHPAHASRGLAPISFDEMYSLAQSGEVEALRASVYRGLNIDSVNSNGDTGLCIAARRHDVYTYNSFRAAGANPRHPCTQKISDYNDFLEKSKVVGIDGTSREALSAMGNKETYKVGSGLWWWLGGAVVAGGALWLIFGHHSKSGDDDSGSGGGSIDPNYNSLGANAYSHGRALYTTSGSAKNTSNLSFSNTEMENLDTIDLRRNALKNTDYIKSILYAENGGSYVNDADTLLNVGVGTFGMNAVKKSLINNDGYIKVESNNASIGMVASEGSAAENHGSGIITRLANPNGIDMNFSGYSEDATIVGMYADTKSNIANYGDIYGRAIKSSKKETSNDDNQAKTSNTNSSDADNSDQSIYNLFTTADGDSDQDQKSSQATSSIGTLIGMEAMILNVGSSLKDDKITVINAANGNIYLSAGDSGTTEESITVGLVGMGSYLDDAFLNGSYTLSRAESVILLNEGTINLSYSGNYTASSSTTLRKGLGGIIGIRADANAEAENKGNIKIVLQDEFQNEGVNVAAGMQSVHGSNLTNSGVITIFTPSENKRINYGMLAVEGSGNNSSLYANLHPILTNTGTVSTQVSNSFGMASFVGGKVINEGRIIVGGEETRFNGNIAMYGYGSTEKAILDNLGTIDLYSYNSIAMQNDYAGGTDLINNGLINVYESAVDSYAFGGAYSNLYNNGTIDYRATSSKQESPAGTGTTYNPFKNYVISIGTSIMSSKSRSIKEDAVDYKSSTTEVLYNNSDHLIVMRGSSYVSAMSVEKNDTAESTQAKAYNYGTIQIEDRETFNATNSVGMYVGNGSLNNAGIYNYSLITTNSFFSAAMASNSTKNADVINNDTIRTLKDYSLGIYVSDVSNVINNKYINIKGSNSVGIQAGFTPPPEQTLEGYVFPYITNAKDGIITVGGLLEDERAENSFGIYADIGAKESGAYLSAQIKNDGSIFLYTKNAGAGIYSGSEGSSITNNNSIKVFGDDAYGIYVSEVNATITNSKDAVIDVGNTEIGEDGKVRNSYAIHHGGSGELSNYGTINMFTEGNSVAIDSTGTAHVISNGIINLLGENLTAIHATGGKVTNKTNIQLLNHNNTGVELSRNAELINEEGVEINVGNEEKPLNNSTGVKTVDANVVNITNKGYINLYNKNNSYAILADGTVNISNTSTGEISSHTNGSTAVLATGNVYLNNAGKIIVPGDDAYGIKGDGQSSVVSVNNSGSISVGGGFALENERGAAIYAPTAGSIINSGSIVFYNGSGYGIYADTGDLISNSGHIEVMRSNDVAVYGGTIGSVSNSGSIVTNEENSRGIAASDGETTITNSGTIDVINGTNGYGIYSMGTGKISNTSGATITVSAADRIDETTGEYIDEIGNGIFAPNTEGVNNGGSIYLYASRGGAIEGNGEIINSGFIGAYSTNNFGISSTGSANVRNLGTIAITNGYGISTFGNVTNDASGYINTPNGISVKNAASLTNSGNIVANSISATVVDVKTITNNQDGLIQNTNSDGYAIQNATGISNYGTITSPKTVIQTAESLSNSGIIENNSTSATLSNVKTITNGTNGVIENKNTSGGNAIQNATNVINYGTVKSTDTAVLNADSLDNYGLVTSASGLATINGVNSVTNNSGGTIKNTNSGDGYAIWNAHTVINYGTIESTAKAAIYYNISGAFKVENHNTVRGVGYGIYADLANASSASIYNKGLISVSGSNSHGIHVLVPSNTMSVSIINDGNINAAVGIYVYKNYHFTPVYDDEGKITGYTPDKDGTGVTEGNASKMIVCTGSICELPKENPSTSSDGDPVAPVFASSLIATNDALSLSNVRLVNRGVITTSGNVDFGTQSEGDAQISIGSGGSYQAESFTGTIQADADIVEGGFETTYVNENSFVGENNGVEVVSQSYLFDASTRKNEEGNTDVVMTMKSFDEVVDDNGISEYLSRNYQEQNSEEVFNILKSAADERNFTSYLNKELGLDFIPNLTKQSFDDERNISGEINDNLLTLQDKSARNAINLTVYNNDAKSKNATVGYKEKVMAVHGFSDRVVGDKLRAGIGLSVARADSDYDGNSSRYNNTVSAFVPIIFDEDYLTALIKPKVGMSRGHYRRDGVNNVYKAKTKEYFYGADIAANKKVSFDSFNITPLAGMDITELRADEINEGNGGLKIKKENTLSARSVLGVDADKKFTLNDHSSVVFTVGGKYFHEFGDKYENYAQIEETSGYFRIDNNRFERDFGLLKFKAGYNWKEMNLDAAVIVPIEHKYNPYYMFNAKYNF